VSKRTIAITTNISTIVVFGEIIIFDCSSSKYLVRPAPEEGIFILLSLAIASEKQERFKNICSFLKRYFKKHEIKQKPRQHLHARNRIIHEIKRTSIVITIRWLKTEKYLN
jgi:hypothetical protein